MKWHLQSNLPEAASHHFKDLNTVFALEGEIVAQDSMTRTLRIEIDGRRYYVKRYAGLGKKPLRRWLTKPRVQVEWENLQHFADWGIPTASIVAYGQEKQGRRFIRGALITDEIPETTDLGRIAHTDEWMTKSRRWRDGVITQVADIARCMHSHHFVHGDFKWRNLLVDMAGRIFLIDCPSGGFWWPPFLNYRIIKDLACLDKVGKMHLSRTWRLRFYLAYAQKQHLNGEDKIRIRNILKFFSGRDQPYETAASLRAAGRRVIIPCSVWTTDGQEIRIDRWLRILPGKRLTGVAHFQDRPVLAKLFIAVRGYEKHWQRECAGIARLGSLNLPTPDKLSEGILRDGGAFVLTEYLDDARTPDPNTLNDLVPVFTQVGAMHASGVLQEDAHLGNFLLKNGKLLVVDGDAIRSSRSKQECDKNLALLFAQLQPAIETAFRAPLLSAYHQGNPIATIDNSIIGKAVSKIRNERLSDYLEKCLRDCSLFHVSRQVDRFFSVVRSEAGALAPVIHDPDAWIEQGIILKRGRTATLARVEIDGRTLVIKRYNIKGAGHALSRCWRPSRAWHSWIAAHRLQFLGIPTPRPLALIERRLGPLRGRAWLISEYCHGTNLADHLADHLKNPPDAEIAAIRTIFNQLAAARITHGDLKATNLLWNAGRVFLLDLDAMRQHQSASSFARAWRKDHERFLQNWPSGSPLQSGIAAILPKDYLTFSS